MRRSIAVVILTLIVLLSGELVGWAYATQLIYKSPQDLGREAQLFLRGRVQSVESYWNSAHTKIFTRTVVAVDETYKGNAGQTVEIVQLGGTVGNIKVSVQGALTWRPGEEVLLFAEPFDGQAFQVSGFSQGKFLVQRDPDTGVAYVQAPALAGAALLGAPAAGAPARRGTSRIGDGQRLTVEEFVSQALGGPAERGVER